MKYLFILLFLPLFGKSQQIGHYDSLGNVTYYTEDTIKLPYSVAKQIAKELVSCDSAKAILELTKEQLTLTENKVYLKDLTIDMHVKKGDMYEERIKNEQLKFDTQGKFVDQLRKQNKKLKVKLLFTKITYSAVIGGLTYLYFTK
jgi:hypothetical protein